MTALSLKAARFLEANAMHLCVYASIEEHLCTYRLDNGSVWTFSRREARTIGLPRFAHLEAA